MFTPEQTKALQAKLDPAHVATRSQSGRSLSYIEGWHAIAEANRIFGFDAWTRETVEIRCVSERERKIGSQQRDGWSVSYVAKVRVTIGAVVREGVGAGHGIDVDCGLAHESAIKEAETDAMKRALMTFGNPFGLALYDKTQASVGVDFDWTAESRDLSKLLSSQQTMPGLVDLWGTDRVKHFVKHAPPDLSSALVAIKDSRKHELSSKQEAA